MPSTDQEGAQSAKWFLHIHPLVWVLAGIILLFVAAQLLGGGLFAPVAQLGLLGFWLAVTGLVVLLVVLLILTKKRPEAEQRP